VGIIHNLSSNPFIPINSYITLNRLILTRIRTTTAISNSNNLEDHPIPQAAVKAATNQAGFRILSILY
jgi:hypothetical protein